VENKNSSITKSITALPLFCLALCLTLLAGCATLDQNMAASRKEHLLPGKEIHLKNMRGYQFCEVALMTGTSKGNAIADFYNSTGTDDCTPERFAGLDKAKIIKETGAREAFLNPSRHWMFDEFDVWEDGIDRTFGGIKMTWMGVVPVEELEKGVTKGHYVPGYIYRNNQFKFNKGSEIYLLDAPNGEVFVMQSFTNFKQKEVTINNIRDLGGKLTLPPGWKFRSVVLDRDLVVNQKRTNNLAHVFQDDMLNAYQGSDGGKAFSFVP
jgi:hypothetical protein